MIATPRRATWPSTPPISRATRGASPRGAAAPARVSGGPRGASAGAGAGAGGHLPAVVCLMPRARGAPPLVQQVLVYPVTDYRFDTPSYRDNAEGYLLTRSDMQW